MKRLLMLGVLVFAFAVMSYGLVGENIIASFNYSVTDADTRATMNQTGILFMQNQGATSVWYNLFDTVASENDGVSQELVADGWVDYEHTVFKNDKVIYMRSGSGVVATNNVVGTVREYVRP